MPIFLDPLPSGTIIDTLSQQATVDLGMSIGGSGTNTISDTDMGIIIDKSLSHINRCLDVCFVQENGNIVPEPTKAEYDLILLQTECLLHQRQTEISTTSEGRGVKRVKLEAIEVEFDSVDKSKNLNAKFGFCQQFEDAILKYKASKSVCDSGDIVWSGNTRRWEEVDHDGTTELETHYDHRDDGGKHPGVDPGDFRHGPGHRSG